MKLLRDKIKRIESENLHDARNESIMEISLSGLFMLRRVGWFK